MKSRVQVIRITDFGSSLAHTRKKAEVLMPILFMALIALAVFLVMGLMLFYAAYAEARQAHKHEAADKHTHRAAHA